MTIGERLKIAREKLNYSQEYVSKICFESSGYS